jgi:NAD(P)H dehydrogenase (quinone)
MILVTGATGHVGRAVVCRLASLGHDVVAMVRDVQAASRRLPSGIALRVADYEDASALKRALAGIEDMVLISSDGNASAVMRHHANAIEAATATNIRHITFTSIVDTDELSPFYFSPVYRDAERRLAVCGVPSTILTIFRLYSQTLACAEPNVGRACATHRTWSGCADLA